MPRPQYIKDLIEAQVQIGLSDSDFQAMMDVAIPYIVQMQEMAGIDIVSDGEWRRKSYIGVIADICSGFELSIRKVGSQRQTWHIVRDEITPIHPGIFAKEAKSLKSMTSREVKVAIPSPYLIADRMWDPKLSREAYPSRKNFAEALVPILRAELIALKDEGVAIVQFDDPQFCLFVDHEVRAQYENPQEEMGYCVDLLNEIISDTGDIRTALHLCRRNKGRSGWLGEGGYEPILSNLCNLNVDMLMLEFAMPAAGDMNVLKYLPERFDIGLGCVDCRNNVADSPQEIADRVERALEYIAPERVTLHPDCGFAPGSAAEIPIDEAYVKLKNEVKAAKLLRQVHA